MNVAQVARVNPGALVPLLVAQTPQQSRQARRLYVGNLPPGMNENKISEFFNHAMVKAGMVKQSSVLPVLAVQLNHEKNFAFVEFRTSDEATAAVALDGVVFDGLPLKIRRPKDYQAPGATLAAMGSSAASEDYQIEESAPTAALPYIPGIVSTNVPDTPNKIFIGGLPAHLNEEKVKELVSAYGTLKSFNLVKDGATGNSKGYAFLEYLDESVTDRACKELNGMKLGDKTLLVQRATIGAKAMTPMPIGVGPVNPAAANFLNLAIPIGNLLSSLPMTYGPANPTRVLVLMNMVSFEDLTNDYDVEDIRMDVRDECERFGPVVEIKIPRPLKSEEEDDTPGVGKIYVEFETPQVAQKAQLGLGGRKYQGRTVITSYFEPDLFHQELFE